MAGMAYGFPCRRLLAQPPGTHPPWPAAGAPPAPLVGSLHLLGDLPHRSLAKLAKIYGPVMSLRLGTVTTVVASTPEAAREFLQKHDAVFATRSVPDALRDHARHSVPWLPHHSPHWRTLRRIMVTELLSSHRLDALQHLRRDKVQELVEHVGRLAREGAAVDIGRVAFATTLNLMSRTIFSSDVMDLDDHGCWSNEFKEVIAEIMEVAARSNLSDFFPALAVVDLQGRRCRMAQLLARMHKVFDVEVYRRLGGREAGEARRNDFLDHLLDAAVGDYGAAGLDRNMLRSMFTDLFTAGSDTSSNTVQWAMVELLRNPFSMAKACNELERVIGSRKNVEEFQITQLPYLQAVVRETFRLHPPAPLLLPRQAEVTIKIMGYTVPKGSRVLINVWAMGQDKDLWPETEKFMPERFLERKVDIKGGDFELIPFGALSLYLPWYPPLISTCHFELKISGYPKVIVSALVFHWQLEWYI